jgi:hypothetical protein
MDNQSMVRHTTPFTLVNCVQGYLLAFLCSNRHLKYYSKLLLASGEMKTLEQLSTLLTSYQAAKEACHELHYLIAF